MRDEVEEEEERLFLRIKMVYDGKKTHKEDIHDWKKHIFLYHK